jgi:hypothetical protein
MSIEITGVQIGALDRPGTQDEWLVTYVRDGGASQVHRVIGTDIKNTFDASSLARRQLEERYGA